VLRRIPRIICTHCGRPRVTTLAGWHHCPAATEEHRQNRATGLFWLTCAFLLIGALLWALWHFWP